MFKAKEIIAKNKEYLEKTANVLLEKETLLASDIQKFCDINGVLYNKSEDILLRFPCARKIFDIPERLKKLEKSAFWECKNLEIINIPEQMYDIKFLHHNTYRWICTIP